MTIGQAVRVRFLALRKQNGITVNKWATMRGVMQSTLNNIVIGRNHGTALSAIEKLCNGLGISMFTFFQSDLFDHLEQEVH